MLLAKKTMKATTFLLKAKGRVKTDRFQGSDTRLSLRLLLLQDQDEKKELTGKLEAVKREDAAQASGKNMSSQHTILVV